YDGSTAAALTSVNFTLSGLLGTDTFAVTQTAGSYDSKDVAMATTVTATLSGQLVPGNGTLTSNYSLPTSASGAGHITPQTVTAALLGDLRKSYDGGSSAALMSANYCLPGLVSGESFIVTQPAGSYNSKDVAGATTVSAGLAPTDLLPGSGTLASNYILPTSA